jgi:hypothetical protein
VWVFELAKLELGLFVAIEADYSEALSLHSNYIPKRVGDLAAVDIP